MAFSVDRLEPLYRGHGFQLRKHTGEFPQWTARLPTIVDLDDDERRILERDGEQALSDHLQAQGMFAVPALDIRALAPLHLATELCEGGMSFTRVLVGEGGAMCERAGAICEMVGTLGGQPPEVRAAEDFDLLDLSASHAIVLGGAHENPAAALLADRGWLDGDLHSPGPGGWMVRTTHNIAGLGHNVIHLCADEDTAEVALDALRTRLALQGRRIVLGPTCEVHPGPEALARLGTWEGWRRRFAEMTFRGRGLPMRDIDDPDEFGAWLSECFDCGGLEGDYYNRWPLFVSAAAGRLFMLTGDRRYLRLFRRIMLGNIDYHCNFPGGASYIGDYDFAVHEQLLIWDLLEDQDVFSDEERLIIANFLLASARMAAGHQRTSHPAPEGHLRHNHETFAGLSVFMGGRYFGDYYDLPEADEWLAIGERMFTGPIENRVKHREDANLYQWLVPHHKLVYDLRSGLDTYAENGVLEGIAHQIVATTDNLGWPSDFGDAGRQRQAGASVGLLLQAAAGRLGSAELQWWAEKIQDAIPESAPRQPPVGGVDLLGAARVRPRPPAPPATVEVLALEKHLREMAAPQFPRHLAFDKVALRDGYGPDGRYLLLDGYSVGSHYHYDQNAIIRYTAAGRLWLVDNGYGKISGVTGAGAAYSGRQLGPQDHNTLLVIGEDGEPALPPPFCALLTAETDGPLSLVQSALVGYAGVDWLRSIVWLAGVGALVVDQVTALEAPRELRCQLNMLGEVDVADGRLRCEQEGAVMHLHFDPEACVAMGAYSNASWDEEFEQGNYPFAAPPVKKLERVACPAAGESLRFVTLIEAARSGDARLALDASAEALTVTGELSAGEATLSGAGLTARLASGRLAVALTSPWPVPADVPRLPARDDRYLLHG